jgi:hypothetical protein
MLNEVLGFTIPDERTASAEIVSAWRNKQGLEVQFRVEDSACSSTIQLNSRERKEILAHYDVENPFYLSGKTIDVFYFRGEFANIGLNGSH